MVIAVDDMDNMLEPLPKQLEAVKPATEFPTERHRWNTNEVMVYISISYYVCCLVTHIYELLVIAMQGRKLV